MQTGFQKNLLNTDKSGKFGRKLRGFWIDPVFKYLNMYKEKDSYIDVVVISKAFFLG